MSRLLSEDGGADIGIACLAATSNTYLSQSQSGSVATGRSRPAMIENSRRRSGVALGAGRGAGPLKRTERGTSPQSGAIALKRGAQLTVTELSANRRRRGIVPEAVLPRCPIPHARLWRLSLFHAAEMTASALPACSGRRVHG